VRLRRIVQPGRYLVACKSKIRIDLLNILNSHMMCFSKQSMHGARVPRNETIGICSNLSVEKWLMTVCERLLSVIERTKLGCEAAGILYLMRV
jgi:hypothetical protein